MSEAYVQYQRLVARVEALGQAILQQYPAQVTCHAGCDGCCYQQFTVFPVEAQHLAQAVAALSPTEREALRAHVQQDNPWQVLDTPAPCVLLDAGRCRLYSHRPLICRIHGLPIASSMIERTDGGQRDCCPLNFRDMSLQDIASQAVYNLDVVNQTLAAINHLFVQESAESELRLSMRQAILQALITLTSTTEESV
ncbi:MAG: YkgJ family cysteine cluster protein [Candidatus Tectomicrobia bacterium]|uniref:YkgJ family cysteine cluster protein n=1 Tax=Tectimicrobiota bacterium TaxID=2528274 RepID=A0A938B1H8_UNCTE|nr:YkgJ family cysteine cluster protein [Candidatus Tectomicrobia bacterium]